MIENNHHDYRTALQLLQAGNARYLAGKQLPLPNKASLAAAAQGQQPYACIVTCSDSRINPETIFCTAPGSLFTIRTAGNTIGEHTAATLAYASYYLGVPLAVVMGHTHCGAVEAARADTADPRLEPILREIRTAIGDETDLRCCEMANARYWAKYLAATSSFKSPDNALNRKIVAALYEIETGKVIFDNSSP